MLNTPISENNPMEIWGAFFGNSTVARGSSQGHVHYSNFIKLVQQYALSKQIEELERLHKAWESMDDGDYATLLFNHIKELRALQEKK